METHILTESQSQQLLSGLTQSLGVRTAEHMSIHLLGSLMAERGGSVTSEAASIMLIITSIPLSQMVYVMILKRERNYNMAQLISLPQQII